MEIVVSGGYRDKKILVDNKGNMRSDVLKFNVNSLTAVEAYDHNENIWSYLAFMLKPRSNQSYCSSHR